MKVVEHEKYGTVCLYDNVADIKPMVDRLVAEDEYGWQYKIENCLGSYAIAVYDEAGHKLGLI